MMRVFAGILIISLSILLNFSSASAWRGRGPVTPYGDFCPNCSLYGKCKFLQSTHEAGKALDDYYSKKGLVVEIEHVRGRFIRAVVKERGRVVDTVIFDRRTGRLRSIH